MVQKRSKTEQVCYSLILIVLALSALMCLIPIIHSLAISLSDKSVVAAGEVFFLPKQLTFSSYIKVLGEPQFFRSFTISIIRVLLGGIINMFLTITMSYPLSKENDVFFGRRVYIWLLVSAMLFARGLIPFYITVNNMGLNNTIWALVIPSAVPVWNVIIMMNFFRNVPKEMEEAALIDGAGQWRIMFKIYVPMSIPAVATTALFVIVGHWNSFFDGLIFMNDPANYPLQTYIQQLVVQLNRVNEMSVEELKQLSQISSKTLNTAKIIISMIPIMIIYPFLQKYLSKGIVIGAVKG